MRVCLNVIKLFNVWCKCVNIHNPFMLCLTRCVWIDCVKVNSMVWIFLTIHLGGCKHLEYVHLGRWFISLYLSQHSVMNLLPCNNTVASGMAAIWHCYVFNSHTKLSLEYVPHSNLGSVSDTKAACVLFVVSWHLAWRAGQGRDLFLSISWPNN